jgi:transposase
MTPSNTLDVGFAVQQDSLAVADVVQAPGAEVIALGAIGTRPWDIDMLLPPLQSTSAPLMVVYNAGPCGSWWYRELPKPGQSGEVVAPALMPKQAGARVNTDRRDARQLARLRRSGALTQVSVPAGEDDALRDLRRAREEAIRDLQTAE